MSNALLVGNGFSSQLIKSYSNTIMMSNFKVKQPVLYQKADKMFAPFRKPVSSIRFTMVGRGYLGDDIFLGEEPILPGPICGLPYNDEIISHIETTLFDLGFVNRQKQVCNDYFLRYGLVYETQRNEISSIECLLKVISLFEEIGCFSKTEKQKVIKTANLIYFNDGCNRLDNVDKNRHLSIKRWLSKYKYIFTTNYDCLLDDAYAPGKVMHLHGGFFYKDRFTKTEDILNPDEAYLIWGISGGDKASQMEGGLTIPIDTGFEYPFEFPLSLFDQYLFELQFADIHHIDIFGYSGENDQHINHTITSNNALKTIKYYCSPDEINSEALHFELTERFKVNPNQKLTLHSWNEIWSLL